MAELRETTGFDKRHAYHLALAVPRHGYGTRIVADLGRSHGLRF